ncbi:MAG: phage tail protein [Xanthomonadaceae bacterium]|nr:phage tail protein [Xanthomonadaceae bacterium]
MGGSKKQTVGYWYRLGLHFGWCHGPIDALTEIRGGDRTAWAGHQTHSGRIRIRASELWGGKKGEGGIDGEFDVMFGEQTQQPNDYLMRIFGAPQSAHRGLATGVFRGGKIGANNPYPKPWAFKLRRILRGWDGEVWYPERATIPLANGAIHAINPAHLLYQTLTDRHRGQGEPRTMINEAAWRATADRLYAEGFGLCAIYRGSSASDLVAFQQHTINIIGAVLQQDPRDGLYRLDLIRDDEAIDTLAVVTSDDIIEIEIEPSTPTEATNQITVEWFDPIVKANRTTGPVRALAAIRSAGGVHAETLTMREIPTESLALRVAARELHSRATPVARIRLTLNRRAFALRAGRPFRLQCPEEGITDMVCLVADIDRGTLTRGQIQVTALQDAARMADTTYVQAPPVLWQPPSYTPMPAPYRCVFEAPYTVLDAVTRERLPLDAGYLLTVGARPTGMALDYALATAAPGEEFETRVSDVFEWCPTAQAVETAGPLDTQCRLTARIDLASVTPGSAALWEDEIVRVDALNPETGTVILGRGCADTVPVAHAAGTRLWFFDGFEGADQREYAAGERVSAKLLTRTPAQQLTLEAAPVDTITMARRAARPYPPANLHINGELYPSSVSGTITVTWSHRDRVLQADQWIDTTLSDIGPEPGTTYTVRWHIDDVLVNEQTAITGMQAQWKPSAQWAGRMIRIEVETIRDALRSWHALQHTLLYRTPHLVTGDGRRIMTLEGRSIMSE